MLSRIVLIAALIAPAALGSSAPLEVTFDQLASQPKRYSGKRVAVVAYYNIDSAEHSTYLARIPKAEFKGLPQIFVDLPKWVSDAQARATKNRRIKIVGRFEYRYVGPIKETPVRGKPSDEIQRKIVTMQTGFGWMGIYDMQITRITEFKLI
jgi:hypothetical protein